MRALIGCLAGACLLAAPAAARERTPDRANYDRLAAAAEAADIDRDPAGYRAAQEAALAEAQRIFPAGHAEIALRMGELGTAEAALGNYDKALPLLDAAAAGLEGAGAPYREGYYDARSGLGFVFNYRGEHARARTEFADVVAGLRADASGPSALFAAALSNLAASEFEAGRLDEALALNAEATAMGEGLKPVPNDLAVWYANRIVYLYSAGRTEEAIAAARNGIARSETVLSPDHPSLANLLANLGSLLVRQGRPRDAFPVLRRAFENIEAAAGAPTQNSAAIRVMFAQALIGAGRHDDAAAFLEAAMPVLDAQLGPESDRALSAREALGLALSRTGRHPAAREVLRGLVAVRDARLPAGHRDRMFGRVNLAKAAMAAGDLGEAEAALGEAVALRSAAVPPSHPDLLAERAMLLAVRSRARPEAAATLGAEARSLLSALAQNAGYRAEAVLTERERTAFGHIAEVLIRAGDVDGAFEAQQYAARTSVDDAVTAAAAERAAAAEPELAGLLAARRKLAGERQALFGQMQAQLQKPAEGFDLAALAATIDEATARMAEADRALGVRGAALRPFSPQPLSAVQAGLGRGEAFLMATQFADAVGVTLATRDGQAQYLVDGAPGDIEQAVAALRATLDPAAAQRPYDRAGAAALYLRLVDRDARKLLRGGKRLLVSANGALAAMPFGALIDERGGFVIDRMVVARLPGAPRPNRGGAAARGPIPALVAVGDVGSAENDSGQIALRSASDAGTVAALPRLPLAGAELAKIAAALGIERPVVLTGRHATEEALRKLAVPRGAVLAFATHGLVSGELEGLREPALLLTAAGSDDGLLTAGEIGRMDLPAEWVILSACNTLAGAGPDAPGLSGLAQAFILAGARNILASHWPVRDDAAHAISVGTARAVGKGADPAGALRDAIRAFRKDPSIPDADRPALWAAFELIDI